MICHLSICTKDTQTYAETSSINYQANNELFNACCEQTKSQQSMASFYPLSLRLN